MRWLPEQTLEFPCLLKPVFYSPRSKEGGKQVRLESF